MQFTPLFAFGSIVVKGVANKSVLCFVKKPEERQRRRIRRPLIFHSLAKFGSKITSFSLSSRQKGTEEEPKAAKGLATGMKKLFPSYFFCTPVLAQPSFGGNTGKFSKLNLSIRTSS